MPVQITGIEMSVYLSSFCFLCQHAAAADDDDDNNDDNDAASASVCIVLYLYEINLFKIIVSKFNAQLRVCRV